MDKKLFERLVESMQQHEEIRRGERTPSREFFGWVDRKTDRLQTRRNSIAQIAEFFASFGLAHRICVERRDFEIHVLGHATDELMGTREARAACEHEAKGSCVDRGDRAHGAKHVPILFDWHRTCTRNVPGRPGCRRDRKSLATARG
jgi:hypothetical protein